jgi:hypothetical protein
MITQSWERLYSVPVACAGYDERAEQTESLFNSPDLRKNGVVVHDTPKTDDEEQRLEVDGIYIDLDSVNDKTHSSLLQVANTGGNRRARRTRGSLARGV